MKVNMEIDIVSFRKWMKQNYGIQEQQNYENTQTEQICLKFAKEIAKHVASEVLRGPYVRI